MTGQKNKIIRWGIVGTGNIAHKFALGLKLLDDSELVAVASRTMASAGRFGDEFGVKHRHTDIAALAANPEVDIVYIATPNTAHCANTLTALEGGKAVLCEKPFAMNAAEATSMIHAARAKGLFLMEAVWSFFFPAMEKVRSLIASGALGEIRLLQSNFCFRAAYNPDGRLFSPELGGGALLDVGIYNVALARMVYQRQPDQIRSMAHIGETGVDEQSSAIFGYEGGAMEMMTSSVRTGNPRHEAMILGTGGHIRIPHMFWQPDQIIVKVGDGPEQTLNFDRIGGGINYEAAAVAQCLRNGGLESAVIPLATTLDNIRTLDRCRAQWGLVYPSERPDPRN
ncbi:MAG: Gfo/Idh/MocA family oxidoreductase [Akkermansiaceae bacterium]|nr:Gfo/Idh/MocA family oxidoreductase [Akkermansiaceae bacterium]